jgi:Tol biopolymer transport system component
MAARPPTIAAIGLLPAALCALAISSAPAAQTASPGRIVFASNRGENLNADLFAVGVDRYSRRNLTRTVLDHDHGAQPSPDGRRILFQRGFAGEAPIFVGDRDGANARQVGLGANPMWSPDGARIAYNDLRGEIFVMNADGSGVRRTAAGMLPSWSPDGSRLAYVRNEGGFRFFVADADGSGERHVASQLTDGGVVTDAPRWSPDGRYLVVQSGDIAGPASVTVIDIATGDAQQLVLGVHPRWSPDGSLIAFADPPGPTAGIGLIRPDGTGLRSLTSGSTSPLRSDDYPSWSPDGRRLVFVRTGPTFGDQAFVVNADGGEPRRVTRESAHSSFFQYDAPVWLDDQTILFSSLLVDNDLDLYTMRPNGQDVRRLTNNDADERQAVWSPDGRRIAFARTSLGHRTSIWVMDAEGRRGRRLTPPSVEPAVSPTWSPDGRRLAFAGVYRHAAALYVMDADGKRLARVRGPSAGGIEGVSVDWSPDGKRLVYGWEPGPPQVFVVAVRGGEPRKLTRDREVESFTPRWSPDGRTIAFVRGTPCGRNCDIYAVVTMTAAGTRRREVVKHAFDPAWSPDGRRLVFSLNGRIAVAGRSGSNVTILSAPTTGFDAQPDWSGPPRGSR